MASFSASISVSKRHTDIPETFSVTLQLKYPAGYHVDLQGLTKNLLKGNGAGETPFKLISKESKKDFADQEISETITFNLQPLVAGKFPITFMKIPIFLDSETSKSLPQSIISDIAYIDVSLDVSQNKVSIPVAPPLDLKDSLPLQWEHSSRQEWLQHHLYINSENWSPTTLPTIAVVTLLLLLLALYISKKKTLPIQETPASELNFQKAKEILNEIEITSENKPQQVADYISKLSISLKSAFEEQFHVNAKSQTSEEFLISATTNNAFPEGLQIPIKQFLETTDLVKFADLEVTKEECQKLFAKTTEILDAIRKGRS